MKPSKSIIIHLFVRLFACSIPFILLIVLYISLDPFYVLWRNESPSDIHWNRDVTSSREFIKNNPKYHYKSFIFGNSRSLAFLCRNWAPYVGDSNAFHFDAMWENIDGIYEKIRYLDSTGNPLKNALIINDPTIYNLSPPESFLYIKDYKITGSQAINFHWEFLKTFYSNFFFVRYIDYYLFRKYRPYMLNYIPTKKENYTFDEFTNDPHYSKTILNEIANDSLNFYKQEIFLNRNDTTPVARPCLKSEETKKLKEIKKIFDKHKTNYKIVLSPEFSQEYFNPEDVKLLRQIFGTDNVFDFSGKNSITNQIGNYYDNSHYKIYIGDRILRTVYKGEKIL